MIGGSRRELDRMGWDDFCAELDEALHIQREMG